MKNNTCMIYNGNNAINVYKCPEYYKYFTFITSLNVMVL